MSCMKVVSPSCALLPLLLPLSSPPLLPSVSLPPGPSPRQYVDSDSQRSPLPLILSPSPSTEEVMWTYTPGGKDLVYGPLLGTYVDFAADPGAGGESMGGSCSALVFGAPAGSGWSGSVGDLTSLPLSSPFVPLALCLLFADRPSFCPSCAVADMAWLPINSIHCLCPPPPSPPLR